MTVFLSIDQLSKRRHEAPDRYLFQGITAEVHRGQRVALLGVSGQGKTTLLRIIARLDAWTKAVYRCTVSQPTIGSRRNGELR